MGRLSSAILLGTIILTGASASATTQRQDHPPNVILIVTDDQRYGDMSCHGNPWLYAPRFRGFHDVVRHLAGGHRIACFVRWPRRLKPGHEVEQLTSCRDWLPTLIQACDLDAPDGVPFGCHDSRVTHRGRYGQSGQFCELASKSWRRNWTGWKPSFPLKWIFLKDTDCCKVG